MPGIFSIEIQTLIRIHVRIGVNWKQSQTHYITLLYITWKRTCMGLYICALCVIVEGRSQCQVAFSVRLQVLSWEWISHSSHGPATPVEQQYMTPVATPTPWVSAGCQSSGSHACVASTLITESAPEPNI